MRLSEREKKYVLLLVVLLLLAALYYFFTAAVEPFLAHKEEVAIELANLDAQLQVQQAKLQQLPAVTEELTAKQAEAVKVVAPFYPALPQDRLMLQVQDLVLSSGLTVNSVQYSGLIVAEPGQPRISAMPITYPLKDLSDVAMGYAPPTTESTPEDSQTDGAVPVAPESGLYAVPQAQFNLAFSGSHDQVVAFLKAAEGLKRTLTVSALREDTGEAVVAEEETETDTETEEPVTLLSGDMTLIFHAVEKPTDDPFMEWKLAKSEPKTALFQRQYAEGDDALMEPETEAEPETGTEPGTEETQ